MFIEQIPIVSLLCAWLGIQRGDRHELVTNYETYFGRKRKGTKRSDYMGPCRMKRRGLEKLGEEGAKQRRQQGWHEAK